MLTVTTEHNFQHMYGGVLLSATLTYQGLIQLPEQKNKLIQKSPGRQQTSEEDAEGERVLCVCSPHHSVLQLVIPHTLTQKVFHLWP
jgi:hypothetical protein